MDIKKDDTKAINENFRLWVCYWICIAIVGFVFDILGDVLYYVPFIYELRLALCLYLYHPHFRGALVVVHELVGFFPVVLTAFQSGHFSCWLAAFPARRRKSLLSTAQSNPPHV